MTMTPQSAGEPDTHVPAEALMTQFEAPEPSEAVVNGKRTRKQGQVRDIWRRFKKNKLAVGGLVVVLILQFLAVFGRLITPYNPGDENLENTDAPPSAAHWFGTDGNGADLFSQVIAGTKYAMLVGWGVMLLSLFLGVALGCISGFRGKSWDTVIMRSTDVFLAFPLLIGAIFFVQVFGNGLFTVIIALTIFGWPTAARLMRGSTLSLRESEYVEAARSIGASDVRIVVRHILPNAIAPTLIYSFSHIGVAVVAMASLAFLGIGVPPDIPEWGRIIEGARSSLHLEGQAHMWMFPSLAIVITTLAFAFVADGLRDSLDPKLR